FVRSQHAFERAQQRGNGYRQLHILKQPAQILHCIRDTLKKMSLAFKEAAVAISAQCLQDADVNIRIVVLHECRAIKINETGKTVQIMIEQLLPEMWR